MEDQELGEAGKRHRAIPSAGTKPTPELSAALSKYVPRGEFDCCGYRSKNGKKGCGALRYYHDDGSITKNHKFVEPNRMLTDKEIIVALVDALETLAPRCDFIPRNEDAKKCGAVAVAEGSFGLKYCDEHRGERELVDAGVKAVAALSFARGDVPERETETQSVG